MNNALDKEVSEKDEQPSSLRAKLAEHYLEFDLGGQQAWYSKRASTYKQRAQTLTFLVIGLAPSPLLSKSSGERLGYRSPLR